VKSGKVEKPVVEPGDRTELRLADFGRAPDDGVEHRLDVCWRPRDHAQDLARGDLLGQSFVALGGTLVEFPPERGNGLPQIGPRVVEHCHSVASPACGAAGIRNGRRLGCRAARTPGPSGTRITRENTRAMFGLLAISFGSDRLSHSGDQT